MSELDNNQAGATDDNEADGIEMIQDEIDTTMNNDCSWDDRPEFIEDKDKILFRTVHYGEE